MLVVVSIVPTSYGIDVLKRRRRRSHRRDIGRSDVEPRELLRVRDQVDRADPAPCDPEHDRRLELTPGTDDRRQRQSVALHLIGLCHWLEHGIESDRLTATTQRLASDDRAWPWLTPPVGYPMTVVDVLIARDGAEHVRLVTRWAETTWDAWAAHHQTVRAWAGEALGDRG